MATIWFSIGSNINRKKNITFAITQLHHKFNPLTLSPVYQTQAVGFVGNDFYNLVGSFNSELTILELRQFFDQLEQQSGRIKTGRRFEDRTLDLDILLYDQVEYSDQRISIPHPDLLEYDFILLPLSELNPNYVHPKTGKTLAQSCLLDFPNTKLTAVDLSLIV